MDMSVLVVGSVAIDSVETPYGRADHVLGGSASYFSLAARHFAPVRVVAVVGRDDFPQEHLDLLASRGVDVGGIARVPGESFYWAGAYGRELKQAQSRETRLGVFKTFDPVLRAEERGARLVFLANIDPDLQLKVLAQVERPDLIVLDTMNYWIMSKRDALEHVLSRVDVVMLNDEELALFTGDDNVVRGSQTLLGMGPTCVVIKRGEHGAMMRRAGDHFVVCSYPTEEVTDPTGAGDSFAGGFVGHLAKHGADPANYRRAVAAGVTMASFTVEAFSVARLVTIDDAMVTARFEALRRMTTFDP
jgi:sugar/nucleoside kinase (ribokinase family)